MYKRQDEGVGQGAEETLVQIFVHGAVDVCDVLFKVPVLQLALRQDAAQMCIRDRLLNVPE